MTNTYLNSQDLRICEAVLDKACRDLGSTDNAIRSEAAVRILARFNAGERDTGKLQECATAWLISS
ncbi:hypothetical protein BH10PSE7_BH10PSE7_27600 [soil metagenome]